MTTKEINDLMSLIADTAFRIGIIIDKAYIKYQLGKINSTIERRLKKEFGFTLNTKTFSLPELYKLKCIVKAY